MEIRLTSFDKIHLEASRCWMNTPEIARPFFFNRKLTQDNHKVWFEQVKEDMSQKIWAIEDLNARHIGTIGLKNIDMQNRRAEIWTYIGDSACRGKGAATKALHLACYEAFCTLNIRKLYLHVLPDNEPALRLYEGCGFKREGLLQNELEGTDGNIDLIRMGLESLEFRKQNNLYPRVCCMQPAFIPWLGYFELIDAADIFIFLDDFQFSRQNWGQRNHLFMGKNVVNMVTLPVQHKGNLQATFLDIQVNADQRWYKKFLTSLEQVYSSAQYQDEIIALIKRWLEIKHDSIGKFLTNYIFEVCQYTGIETKIMFSSKLDYDCTAQRSKKVLSLLHTVEAAAYISPIGSLSYMVDDGIFENEELLIFFQNHNPIPYHQVNSSEFVPKLSSLDALFNLSAAQFRTTTRGTQEWLTWEKATILKDTLVKKENDSIPLPTNLS